MCFNDATSLVANHLDNKGLSILNYIDDLEGGGVAPSKLEADAHFSCLNHGTLKHLWLVEAKNKASPPSK